MNAVQRIGLCLFLPLVLLIDSGQVTCTNFPWVVTGDVISVLADSAEAFSTAEDSQLQQKSTGTVL